MTDHRLALRVMCNNGGNVKRPRTVQPAGGMTGSRVEATDER